ncbi:hypothetical protein EVAR_99917_1 [Eumeta japonica]|uniref:Uncharacterized protein n=1 Tax=Eumeta variegata TaxID=151549 RepID=A0A4C2A5A1_EUMVA|nr:hypothetical protein EVAR_99917_1 [Eumeta japonica]
MESGFSKQIAITCPELTPYAWPWAPPDGDPQKPSLSFTCIKSYSIFIKFCVSKGPALSHEPNGPSIA